MWTREINLHRTVQSIPFFAVKAWREGQPLNRLHLRLPSVPEENKI